jgi:hypothetical protein
MNALPEIEIGADHQPTIRLRKAVRDVEGEYVLDSFGQKTYEALDMSLYDDILICITVKHKEVLVAKYKRAASGDYQALDTTDEAEGKLYLNLGREYLSDLEADDILEVEIGYYTTSAGFKDNKYNRISTQEMGVMVKPHKALRDALQ